MLFVIVIYCIFEYLNLLYHFEIKTVVKEFCHIFQMTSFQKQSLGGVFIYMFSEKTSKIYRRTPTLKCDFNSWNCNLVWVFVCSVSLMHTSGAPFHKKNSCRMIVSVSSSSVWVLNNTQWKNLCFTEFSTKFIEIQCWQLLKFFICLHTQLSSFNSDIVQMSKKRDSSNRQ